jgi:GT2 family glycosyltransferase
MELSVIFVNWNSVDYLRDCIASIYANTNEISFEVIVVDNASPQEGVETLKSQFPDVLLIKSAKNVGFAAANNLGFQRSTGAYVLFLNPDTKLLGPSIDTMVSYLRTLPDAGIVGCKMLNADRSVQITSIQKFPTILNQLVNIEYLHLLWPGCPVWDIGPLFSKDLKWTSADVIPGACMLLKRSVFEQAGMFSEEYFMYAEDLDLNYKIRRAGHKNYYVGEAAIIHYGGGSSSRQKVSHWATIMKHRAMTRYFRKTRGRFYETLYRTVMGCSAAGRLAILTLLSPFRGKQRDKESLQFASEKWRVVLRWAIGRQDLVLGDR